MRTRDDWAMPVCVVQALEDDFGGWLRLAAEMEPSFGPMASDPLFHEALRRSIVAGTAFCVRDWDGPPGCSLLGGVMLSAEPGGGRIGWLGVTRRARRHGIGRALLDRALFTVDAHATITVTTFADDLPDGLPARRLYEQMGFAPAEDGPTNLAARRTQVYRRNPP